MSPREGPPETKEKTQVLSNAEPDSGHNAERGKYDDDRLYAQRLMAVSCLDSGFLPGVGRDNTFDFAPPPGGTP